MHTPSRKRHLWEFILRKSLEKGTQDEGGQPSIVAGRKTLETTRTSTVGDWL